MKTTFLIAVTMLSVCATLVAADPMAADHWSEPSAAGNKPVMDMSSRYRLIDKSIQNGEFGGIHPSMIYRYGQPFQKKIDGKHYWLVPVRYFTPAPSASIYTQGRILAEAYACINHDRLEFWVFKYSQRFGL
jgi:hypothetical protein